MCQHCCGTGDNLKNNTLLFDDSENDSKEEYLNRGFVEVASNDIKECPFCKNKLSNVGMPYKDFYLVKKISKNNRVLLESFMNLINNDIITYNIRIKEYEILNEKFKTISTTQNKKESFNILKCPKCGSTAVTTCARGVNGFWGFIGAGKTVNRCGNCGHTWKPRG